MIEPRQIRAARALLNWSQDDLANASGIARSSIKNIENDITTARKDTIGNIQTAFENCGIEFLPNSGVRFKQSNIEVYDGVERFHDFASYMHQYLEKFGGDVCVMASDERQFAKYRKDVDAYRQSMSDLVSQGRIKFRILTEHSDFNSKHAEMRMLKTNSIIPTSFYAFGQNLALISFVHQNPPHIVLFKDSPFADAFRDSFNLAWEHAKVVVSSKN